MTNRSHLVPSPVVDKNGKVTTVYRKPAGKYSTVAVPAPEVATAFNEELVRETARELLKDAYVSSSSSTVNPAATRRGIVSALKNYSDEMVQGIHDVLMVGGDEDEMENLRESLRDLITEDPSESELREALLFYPVLSRWSGTVAKGIIDSLREYEQIPRSADYSLESDEVKANCLALVRVASEVFSFPYDGIFKSVGESKLVIANDDLTDLVLEYPERADQIAAAIAERKTVDPVLLRRVIASDSMVLGNGSL